MEKVGRIYLGREKEEEDSALTLATSAGAFSSIRIGGDASPDAVVVAVMVAAAVAVVAVAAVEVAATHDNDR